MKKLKRKRTLFSVVMLIAFVVWTVLVKTVDVRSIGPNNSFVGFASLNGFVHKLIGVRMFLYDITDWLSILPFIFVIGFGGLGLIQLIKRRKIQNVDYNLLCLGGFYVVVLLFYFLFEVFIVNYRPVLINGVLEPSYPSSTTMLVMCVMPTVIMQFNIRIKNLIFRRGVCVFVCCFTGFMVICRVLSGVHWFTDIIGGILVSIGLVTLYYSIAFGE